MTQPSTASTIESAAAVVDSACPATAASDAQAAAAPRPKTRAELIQDCQGLVRALAWQIHARLARVADVQDLIQYGQIGLAEAARDYDPQNGTQFTTFAYYRIRGAIYDGVSKMSWFSRAQFRRMQYERRAEELLAVEAERGGEGSRRDVADEARWLKRVGGELAVAYLSTLGIDEEGSEPALADPDAAQPSDVVAGQEIQQVLRQLVDALPVDAGNLIRAAYFEGLSLQEAGRRIGVSKAWASRLHARTLERLARSLKQRQLAE
jgi:RNA polymerase sigma factor for flagellar operon FliA